MADERLCSIMQISDLHFGDLLPNGDASLPPGLTVLPVMSGQLGHHRMAARDLRRLVIQRRARHLSDLVIVNGDLTACGSPDEFALARSFLGAGPPHPGFGVSLGLAHWVDLAVSGNHDQWPGTRWILGRPTRGLTDTFRSRFPRVGQITLAPGVTLTLAMVDSDDEVGPYSASRALGRGRFARQLAVLERQLPPCRDGEIRVLVVHHAIADDTVAAGQPVAPFPRPPHNARWRRLEIAPESLSALEQVLVDHSFRVVMTGHRHAARLTRFGVSRGAKSSVVLEAQCGTTTQRDVPPRGQAQGVGGTPPFPALPPNALIIHELARRGGALVWTAEIYRRVPGRGFVPVRPPMTVSGLGPMQLQLTI